MYRKTFVCLCKQTISSICTIFNTVRTLSDMNSIHQFQDIGRIFMIVIARTGRQTDRQTECINTFQLCRKVLKKEHLTYLCMLLRKYSKTLILTFKKLNIYYFYNFEGKGFVCFFPRCAG